MNMGIISNKLIKILPIITLLAISFLLSYAEAGRKVKCPII